MAPFARIFHKRRSRQNDNSKEKTTPKGASKGDFEDLEKRKRPCGCNRCMHFHEVHRSARSPTSYHRKKPKHQNCCPYCDENRKFSAKHQRIKNPPSTVPYTERIPSQEEKLFSTILPKELTKASKSTPRFKETQVRDLNLSTTADSTGVINNKISSDLGGRSEYEDGMYHSDAETSISSGYTTLVDAATQTFEPLVYHSPLSTTVHATPYSPSETKRVEMVYNTQIEKVGEQLKNAIQQQLQIILQGINLVVEKSFDAKTFSDLPNVSSELPLNREHSNSQPSNTLHSNTNQSQHTHPKYEDIKPKCRSSPLCCACKLADTVPKQDTSGFSSQECKSNASNTQPCPAHCRRENSVPSLHCVSCGTPIVEKSKRHQHEVITTNCPKKCYLMRKGSVMAESNNNFQTSLQQQTSEQRVPYSSVHILRVASELSTSDKQKHSCEHTLTLQTPCLIPVQKSVTFEEKHMNKEGQESLELKDSTSTTSSVQSANKRKQVFNAIKKFFSKKSSTRKGISDSESAKSQEQALEVENDTSVPLNSVNAKETEVFGNKFKTKHSLGNINNELKENAHENIGDWKLPRCAKCSHCALNTKNSSNMSKTKESRDGLPKKIVNRSTHGISELSSALSSSKHYSCNTKCSEHILPIPFCYWFEIINGTQNEKKTCLC